MRKESGSISILVLFVFVIISLLLLYMLSSIEMRINANDNMYDGLQSSYISESIAHIVLEKELKEDIVPSIFNKNFIEMENLSFGQGKSKEIILNRGFAKEKTFSTFSLDVVSEYKKIESKTQIIGELVNDVFHQEDGVLNRLEIEKSEYSDRILKGLSGDLTSGNWNINGLTLLIQNNLKAKTISKTIVLEEINNKEEGIFLQDKQYPEINLSLANFITVDGELEFEDDTEYVGILRISENGSIKVDSKLRISGVLILGNGANISGPVDVDGLLINLGNMPLDLKSKLNCERTEKCLQSLDGFLKIRPIRTKKVIL